MLDIGTIVKSKAGRDKGRLLFVIKIINNDCVLLADGDLRKLEKPKLKKVKHLKNTHLVCIDLKEKVSNREIINNAYLMNELSKLDVNI